ncbi:alpha/beta hydrolase [Jidongwangia harbinensis]|uniref:alpha/beta hydrolase n=1 Tax=Jidongwangia harbinensis TaxID=2878561 RepID=UPI001CD9410D|nr:alpha/beta hydrolase [Jidongwangia harbinensis]MCA2214978.1 alpha/beta hydrolase [Jidongwangia harbinensis]
MADKQVSGRRGRAPLFAAGLALALAVTLPAAWAATTPQDRPAVPAAALRWQPCPAGDTPLECTTVTVPVDWAKPGGRTLTLKVAMLRATGERRGVVFTNPGGPGVSGVRNLPGLARRFGAAVRAGYDIVSWDPRGIGASAPVSCPDGADAAFAALDVPDSVAERVRYERAAATWARDCRRQSGPVFDHVDTLSTARDLDRLRELWHEPKLHYAGFSYGTRIGLFYADLFPHRVGRMVLDSAVDPASDEADFFRGQTRAAEQAFTDYHADCGNRSGCPLGDLTVAQARAWLAPLLRADVQLNGLLPNILRQPGTWGSLDELLGELRAGVYQPNGESGSDVANHAVNCLDLPDHRSAARIAADTRAAAARYPLFGRLMTGSVVCTEWPVPPTYRPHRITARGAAPILVVGTTRDTATPYDWAVSAARNLSSGRLLTVRGTGHVAYGTNPCAGEAIDRYLLTGTPPPAGKVCAAPA